MKIKNKNWIRLTTSIVIISLLYQNILLAQNKHLAPKSNNKDEMQAVMICETIEKRAGYGKPIERIYLDDILKWVESSEEEFSGCRFETLPHEIKIHLASDNIMVRYFDPSKADSISGFKTKIIGPRLHRQIIQVVKELPAITQDRTKSQTALFTMLNGVLRDFMPVVNASLVAVVLRHYPHRDALFAELLYDVIQKSSGLSSLEKLKEFNRLYPNDFISDISAIVAEANELKKALSSGVGISPTGQKLLELFQHDLAFTISVDHPDYIKEVMGSNPSLLNSQGLLVDTLGNTGEVDYDKFSHIDKALSTYPDVKNVFLVFDAASEIKKAREIADRLKKQGKHVHVIGVVYPMSSTTAREALKIALSQAGYSGGIDLNTLNLPDQSFESLSRTLVDAGADIVLSGLSSDLSKIKEIANPPELPFNHIITSHMRLKREQLYNKWVLRDPYNHLVRCRIGEGIGERFKALDINTIALGYNIVHLKNESGHIVYVLAVSEIGDKDQILQTWLITDDKGRFIELEHIKYSTLPAEYVMDEDSYERLARFTYAFTESGKECNLDINSKCTVNNIGDEWIDLHAAKGNRRTEGGDPNVSCGTICESGHEGSYMALDEQLKRQFEELRKVLGIKEEKDLTEEEADQALVEYAKRFGIDIRYEQLQELRQKIKEADEALGQINIFFSIPETGTSLFWVEEDYAGGHFNRAGTRIHISLQIILKRGIGVGIDIAMHELAHIKQRIHRDWDMGFKEVREIALEEAKGLSKDYIRVMISSPEKLRIVRFFRKSVEEEDSGFTKIADRFAYKITGDNEENFMQVYNEGTDKDIFYHLDIYDGLEERNRNALLISYCGDDLRVYIKFNKETPERIFDFRIQPNEITNMKINKEGVLLDITPQAMERIQTHYPDLPNEISFGRFSFSLVSTQAEKAIREFKKMYGQEILEKIRREERYRLFADKQGLDINILQEVIYEREIRFCEHILEHLVTILERANGSLGREKIFVINTSMLYDVDETIGTEIADRWHIRLSILFLFKFLRDNFNVTLGIASTRDKESLDKQLQPGNDEEYSLAEISSFVDPGSVYSIVPVIDEQTLLYDRFLAIYPGFKIFDPKTVLKGFGWDSETIDRFEKVIGPELFKESKRALYAWHYDNLDDPEQKMKLEEEVEGAFRDILISNDPIGRMLSEAQNLYSCFFAHDSKKTDNERSELLAKVEKFGVILSDLETISRTWSEYSVLWYKQIEENRHVIHEFTKRISDILGLEESRKDFIIPAAYRLAAAKDLLDKGLSEVSVTIDDVYDVAEGLYELFIGIRRGPNGEDGFTLFGLDKYRDRLFIFSTSKDGVYSDYGVIEAIVEHKQKMITERFIDKIKVAPAKTDNKKIILALDTDIGNMTQFEIDELLRQIRDVSSLLGDIEFVAGAGKSLAGLIKDAKTKIKIDNIDVIVVTKKNKEDFDSSYHVVRTDDSRLDPASYVPILELLTFALLINLEDNNPLLQEIYKEITGNELSSELKGQIKNSISAIPLLPPIERIPSDFYNTSIEVLKSA